MIVPGSANSLLLAGGGYNISRSVRLRSSASAYLNRTQSAGSQTTWTWSGWVKLGLTGGSYIFHAGSSSGSGIYYDVSGEELQCEIGNGTTQYYVRTSAAFRDFSAWYHLVCVADTSNGTSADRLKIYINGVRQTIGTSSLPTSGFSGTVSQSGVASNIGKFGGGSSSFFDGYLTEINFIDGQALTPSSFGETDSITGVWKPKKYTGTYGTNGFYLNFSDNSSNTSTTIGKDYSGNGNNWTPNNISVTSGVTYDSMLDVPTAWADGGNGRGNYAVLNPLDVSFGTTNVNTLSNGNLTATGPAAQGLSPSTICFSSGKWYFETTVTTLSSTTSAQYVAFRDSGNSAAYYAANGSVGGVSGSSGGSWSANDVIGLAVDKDAGTIEFFKNGVTQGNSRTISTNAAGNSYLQVSNYNGGVLNANFGQRPFSYTPPSGYKALNTLNLPDATIKKGNVYMDASLYTGNGTSQNVTNAAGFQPDLVWFKSRNNAASHALFDSVRGANQGLYSNLTLAEGTWSGQAFLSNGFTVNATYSGEDNTNGNTYVGWQWKKGATQGFDIVTYTGTGANRTIAHSLGVAPKMIIAKHTNAVDNWIVYHASLGGSPDYLWLNLTSAKGTSTAVWNTAPTSSVFGVGTDNLTNLSGGSYVAYLFSEVAGFSKFGSYTGNGSADGPFVYTGFLPRWVMIKRTDSTSGWLIIDTSRQAYNVQGPYLLANTSDAETTGTTVLDVLSNGFKSRSSSTLNTSSGTYIYAAFAENPFKNSLAR